MGTDESLAVSTMSRPTQGPSSSLEEFPQKIGVPLQEPKNKQPLNHLPQEPPKSWGKSWKAGQTCFTSAERHGLMVREDGEQPVRKEVVLAGKDNQPDWNRIAEKFDMWLPQLAPVGEALLSALEARPGERGLDLAS